jgi:hypothetical protein
MRISGRIGTTNFDGMCSLLVHGRCLADSGNISNWAKTTSFPSHSPSSHLPRHNTDSPRFTQPLCSGKSSANWLWRMLEFYIRIVNWMCKHKGVQLKPKFQYTETRSAAAYPPLACDVAQQYSSTILISLHSHSRKEKFDEPQKYYFNFLFCFLFKLPTSELA